MRLEELLKGWENIEEVFHYQKLPYISKVICLELISRYHDNFFAGHFGISKEDSKVDNKKILLVNDMKKY